MLSSGPLGGTHSATKEERDMSLPTINSTTARPAGQTPTHNHAYSVHGLTCRHCASAVRRELEALPGVCHVHVYLEPRGSSTVTVFGHEKVDVNRVLTALDSAGGYRLMGDWTR